MNGVLSRGLRPGAMLHVAPALLSVFLVFYLGSTRDPAMPLPGGDYRDKVGHLLAFAFVQFSHYRAARFLAESKTRVACIGISVASATLVGAALEVWQMTLPFRSAEWADLLADLLGASLMGILVFLFTRGQRV